MEFRLLGPVEIHVDGRSVELGRPQLRKVLAALAVDAGRPVSSDTLAERVWDGTPPTGARGVLYSHITRIRRVLESVEENQRPVALVRRTAGYVLDVDPDSVDLHRFRRLAASAADAQQADQQRVVLWREALGLWRGIPLADVDGQWAARSRVGWRQERLDAAVSWLQAEVRLGGSVQVIAPARELLAEYPLAEPLAGMLMRALATTGRTADALACYAAIRAHLVEELGTEPSQDLQSIHQAVLRAEFDSEPGEPQIPRPAQLPPEVRGFTGRQDALDALDALLDGQPSTVVISAVSGTAGIGKTALAVHWAHRVADRFPDGQLYVNLRGFDGTGQTMSPAEAVSRFLYALGVPAERIPDDADAQVALYRSLLAGKRVLVILDNARDTEQVRPLLPGSPAAFALVTSRNQLTPLVAADGGHPLTIDLLSSVEATALLERRLGHHRIAAEPVAVEQIVGYCARLPLALTIAAARAQQSGFALGALAVELADAGQRLGTLDAGDPATQVRAVFSWSYRTLTPAAARLFRLLGLHPGPETSVAGAASLAGAPVAATRALLVELTRASLISEQAPGRYAFHDLLAAYAAELSRDTESDDERNAATRRLLDHYAQTAHTADRLLDPTRDPIPLALADPAPDVSLAQLADDREATNWLTVEHPALLSALAMAANAGFDTHAWQLAWALDTFLHRRGHWHDRARVWQLAVVAAERLANPAAAAHAHRDLARAENRLGRFDEAHAHLASALDLFAKVGDKVGQAHTHRALASLAERQDQLRGALHHDQQALSLFRDADHRQGQADALNSVGWDHALLGDHAEALSCCQQALALHREIGDRWGEATTWDSLGYVQHQLGGYAEAIDCYQQALAVVRDLGDRYFEAATLTRLGETHHAAGTFVAARDAWQDALAILTDLNHPEADDVRAKLADLSA